MMEAAKCLHGCARLPSISGIGRWNAEKEKVPDMESLEKPVEEQLLVKEEKMELFRKVHVLDEISKEIVLLRVTGAFSFKEIAELFGKNENWARVTYYRAKQKLLKGGEKNEM